MERFHVGDASAARLAPTVVDYQIIFDYNDALRVLIWVDLGEDRSMTAKIRRMLALSIALVLFAAIGVSSAGCDHQACTLNGPEIACT